MKNCIKHLLLTTIALFIFSGFISRLQAQESYCVSGCNDNTFVWSDEPNTIEYDNMVSGFHSTIIREADGTIKVWGQGAGATGANITAPRIVSSANGYTYQGEILKFTLASVSGLNAADQQFAILTTEGLYIWGGTNILVSSSVKGNSTFGKVSIGGNSTGLPSGVSPTDVKMLFGSYQTLGLVTCTGEAWMLSNTGAKSGRGVSTNSGTSWTRVQTASNTNLNNVVAMRGTYNAMMALTSNGDIYTWGTGTYLGNNSGASNNNRYATKMTLPNGVTPKMIGMTYNRTTGTRTQGNSYYLLTTTGELYSLGNNSLRQLGDFSNTSRNSWVRVKSTNSSTNMPEIIWFSPNEHDYAGHAAVSALTTDGKLWSWGSNHGQMIGGGSNSSGKDPINMGRGLNANDKLIAVETGGHTTMVVRECSMKYGYIGHKVNGSMGDGTTSTSNVSTFNFTNTAEINLCGAPTAPVVQGELKMCEGYTIDLEEARIEGAELDKELEWFTDVAGTIPVNNPSSVGPGIYYASYEGNTCAVKPTTKVEVKYLVKGDDGYEACIIADLYTEIDFTIDGVSNPTSAVNPGDPVEFKVTVGNKEMAGDKPSVDVEGAKFAFHVPTGVTIVGTPTVSTSCANEQVPLAYDANKKAWVAELDLPADCSIEYTFEGVLNGVSGAMIPEASVLRPDDIIDIDATNQFGEDPTNPHYECYTDPNGGLIGCNNITEVFFLVLDNCVDEVLYYEDFGRGFWEQNDGRLPWSQEASISVINNQIQTDVNGNVLRNGVTGGATSTYQFAPGMSDPLYAIANATHSANASVARIKNGYYAVMPPGYVQNGIPDTDSWKIGAWDPDPNVSHDPNDPNSNYDWTASWDKPNALRDVSGAVNGSAFLVRGNNAGNNSVKPFYEINLNVPVDASRVYTLNMYSFVTYHHKDYMLMDVIDANTGHIYASVPMVYPGHDRSNPTATQWPEGYNYQGENVSFGWINLEGSFSFNEAICEVLDSNIDVKIVIRGSKDPSLSIDGGFGHTLLDNIMFISRSTDAACAVPGAEITCSDDCYEDVNGEPFNWRYAEGETTDTEIVKEITQPGADGGFVLDIYRLDNSFNMEINGTMLFDEEIEFQSSAGLTQNIRFKSDGATFETGGLGGIWTINNTHEDSNGNIIGNPTPVVRVVIDRWGNSKIYAKRTTTSALEEMELFDKTNTSTIKYTNNVDWFSDQVNNIRVTQNVVGATKMIGEGYGQLYKECETCELEKDGAWNDLNNDDLAQVGETITYAFTVKNLGDMDIHDVEIIDPLIGSSIKIIEISPGIWGPDRSGVTFTGDNSNFGVLDRNETWVFSVDYTITSTDIFTNKGVYNRASVTGTGYVPNSENPRTIDEPSFPTDENRNIPGRDTSMPDHTFVPLKGNSLLITNPHIIQRTR